GQTLARRGAVAVRRQPRRARMRPIRWMRRHPRWGIALALLVLIVPPNVLVYRHAWAMTHFAPAGARTPPQQLPAAEKVGALLPGVRLPRPVNGRTLADVGLDFQTHTTPGATVTLEAWHVPHPTPRGLVLLFHGDAAGKATLLSEARAFYDL